MALASVAAQAEVAYTPAESKSMLNRLTARMPRKAAATRATEGTKHVRAPFKFNARNAAENQIWRAASEDIYVWDGEEWLANEHYEDRYDTRGLLVSETVSSDWDDELSRTTYTYDGLGRMTERETSLSDDNGQTWTVTGRTVRAYDPVVSDVIVSNEEYQLLWGQWVQLGNNYRRDITRDSEGRITKVEISVLYDGAFDPTERLYVTYGADGQADGVYQEMLDYDLEWVDAGSWTDITWLRTNGQIWSVDVMTTPDNAMLSCQMHDEELADTPVHCTFTYPDDMGSYDTVMSATIHEGGMEMDLQVTGQIRVLDAYGSNETTVSFKFIAFGMEVGDYGYVEKDHYDAYGLETYFYNADVEMGEETVMEEVIGDVTYDDTYGYPLDYTLREYIEEGTYEPMMRVVFNDYADVSGNSAVQVVTEPDAAECWYDLQGRRLHSVPSERGVYLHRTSSGISKIAI